MKRKVFFIIVAIALFWQISFAQKSQERLQGSQTTGFSYQGSLKNAGAPANGNYDFEFRLWDSASGGTQVGTTITLNGVAVTNGIFSVTLDFGDQYPDTFRFLEVRVRPTGGGAFTTLTPREQIKAVPYAVKSLNAEQLGGVAANQYVTTTSGGSNFIQNTTTQQASSNFNISGNGIAGGSLSGNVVNAATQYNINGIRVLSTDGNRNMFAGTGAGLSNTTGYSNSFFGTLAGQSNTTANGNAFFGDNAGLNNTTGIFNTFFGHNTGVTNSTGGGNTAVGYNANIGNGASNATAIGVNAFVSQSGSLVLGAINGVNGSFFDALVGIGTTAPAERFHVVGNSLFTGNLTVNGTLNATLPIGSANYIQNTTTAQTANFNISGNGIVGGSVGIGTTSPQQTLHVNGSEVLSTGPQSGFKFRSRGSTSSGDDWVWYANLNIARLFKAGIGDLLTIQPTGEFAINVLGSAGATALCRNASNQISTCSSSKRYKQNINSYSSGLSLIKQLRPVSFNWKQGGMADLGLVAEEVADVEPLLTTLNDKGEVEGVKYDRIGVIAVNAIKEQQAEIEEQRSAISRQQSVIEFQQKQIDALKKIVCSLKPGAEVCKEK